MLARGKGVVYEIISVVSARVFASSFIQTGFAVGPILSSVLAALIIPRWGWRWLFYIGVLPAILAVIIRICIPEPPTWKELQEKARAGAQVGLGD
ncbi:MAG: MFS transporter, partial [Clostridia bacterium]|nr:MFS transporter [Clostridia bacterium]